MSISWKYISELNENNIIDTIYCSSVDMKIPINYFFTVLLKDGTEYDLTDPKLKNILTNQIDVKAFNDAKENYLKLL